MPTLLFQLITIVSDLVIFIFLAYYLWKLHAKEKAMEKKENTIDTNYHQVIDSAFFKERKILEDATAEADQIISGAQFSTQESKDAIRQALHTMIGEMQKETTDTGHTFMTNYESSIKQLTTQSLTDFQQVAHELKTDLEKQIKEFHESLLPRLEKELDAYKQSRMQQTEQMIVMIIQKVAQEVLNKSISMEDHHALLIESLEKAKKQGMF